VSAFRIQHIAVKPACFKVRTKIAGAHRLRIAFPPGRRRKGSGRLLEILHPKRENPARCNPAELLIFGNPAGNQASKELYEDFHQTPPHEVIEAEERQDMPKHTAVLGDFVAIGLDNRTADAERLHGDALAHRWRECSHVSFEHGDVKLAADPHGGQLYFVGGDQKIPSDELRTLGAERSNGSLLVGPAVFIVYNARKLDQGGSMDQYTHEFGEEGGRRPSIYYDPKLQRLLLRGGSYRVEGVGIVN